MMTKSILLLLNFIGIFAYNLIIDEDVSVSQQIPEHVIAGDTFLVEVNINKSEHAGFAKWQQELPPGFIATIGETQNATFSFKDNTVKFIWLSMPKEENFTISYNIISSPEMTGIYTLNGKYSFILDNERKDVFAEEQTLTVLNKDGKLPEVVEEIELTSMIDKETEEITEKKMEEVEEDIEEMVEEVKELDNDLVESESALEDKEEDWKEEEITTDVQTNTLTETENEKKKKELIKKITNVPSAEEKISYKVQIAAGKKDVEKNYFTKHYKLDEKVAIEFHDGWRKYTIGQFDVYKSARDKRNEIWQFYDKLNDSFVTAYNQGERISVQEALMISQQKWYK